MSTISDSRVRIFLYLLGVTIVLLPLAIAAYIRFGSSGLSVLDVVVSGILTAALVILYFRQASILDSQRELFTQELNCEARMQHTETLRERGA